MKSLCFILFFIPAFVMAEAGSLITKEVLLELDGKIALVKLVVPGSGSKSVALLYDQANVAFEKGIKNTTFSKYTPDMPITRIETMNDTRAPWGNLDGTMHILNDLAVARYKEAGSYYFGENDASLSTPRVHNKDTPYSIENEPKKLYVSWWYRPQNDTRDIFTMEINGLPEKISLKEGDEFTVAVVKDWVGITEVRGRVAKYDSKNNILVGNFYAQRNSNKIKARPIVFDNGLAAVLGGALESQGSNKYIRVWESDGADGAMRMSWTNTEIYAGDMRGHPYSNVIARQWNHMELFIDQTRKSISTRVNGKLDFEGNYTDDQDKPGFAPAIGLLGFDASVVVPQQFWMDDIYMDTSFKRVTLANEPNYSAITHEEIQFFTKWSDSNIEFKPNYGGLNRKDPVYIYVYSDNNVPNSKGILLQGRAVGL